MIRAEQRFEVAIGGYEPYNMARSALNYGQGEQSLAAVVHRLSFNRMSLDKSERNTLILTSSGDSPSYFEMRLTGDESTALIYVLMALLSNIKHGIPFGDDDTTEGYAARRIRYFQELQSKHSDPMVRFGLIFDNETGQGQVFVTQPVIPNETPTFDILNDVIARVTNSSGRRSGGINEANNGVTAAYLESAGLSHTPVQTIDELVDPRNPVAGYRRRVWMEFSRDPEYTWQPVLLG